MERYEGAVAATVIGMLGPGADADDVGQEVFVRFYRSLARFRGEAAVKTYLTRIAINQSLKALKRRRRLLDRFISRDRSADEAPSAEPAVSGKRAISSSDRTSAVHAAIRSIVPGFADRVMERVGEEASSLVLLPQFWRLATAAATLTLLLIGYSVLWTEPLDGQSFMEAALGLEPVSIESAYGLDDKLPDIVASDSL